MASKEQKFYVDVPGTAWLPDYDGHWKNCLTGVTKAEALAWIRENIGDCDDDGRICLLVGMGDDGDDDTSDDEVVGMGDDGDDDTSDDEVEAAADSLVLNVRITDIWKAFGGENACSRTTFSAVYHGTYAAMDGPLAKEILAFIDGYVEPEKFGY